MAWERLDRPEKAAALRALLHDWRKEIKAQMPTPNPAYNPAVKPSGKKVKTSATTTATVESARPMVVRVDD